MQDLLIAVLFFLVVILIVFLFRSGRKRPLPYKRVKNLCTPSERRFYSLLQEVLPKGCLLFSKVRVADVLLPQSSSERGRWRSAFNKVACKHFDFVVCDRDLNILFAIELDDSSHARSDRVERDIFLNWACKSAGLPLLRVALQKSYDRERLRKTIESLCKKG